MLFRVTTRGSQGIKVLSCETHSIARSIMFSRAVIEDLGITFQFSCPLTFLGAEDGPSAVQDTNRSNTSKSLQLHKQVCCTISALSNIFTLYTEARHQAKEAALTFPLLCWLWVGALATVNITELLVLK